MTKELPPQLLSSVNGEITAILLVFPGLASDQGDAEYADIVAIFDRKGVVYRFRLEAPEFSLKLSRLRGASIDSRRTREIQDLRPGTDMVSVFESWREEIKSVREHEILTFRRWAQDPFMVLATPDWTILLDSLHNRRLCDFFLPLEIAQQAGPRFLVKPTRLYLEGGNVLRGNRCVFIGRDMIQENVKRLGYTELDVITEFQHVLGGDEIIQVGFEHAVPRLNVDGGEGAETWQPLFHIDMFMSLGGIDPTSGQEIIFLASPSLCCETLNVPNNPKVLASEVEASADGLFHEIAIQLREAGFLVINMPIFFYDNATFSWSNCLVEIFGNQKRVYLPSYQCEHDPEKLNPSFQCLETKVEGIFSGQGFEVIWFQNGRFFRTLARHGGSLHCAVKVIARKAT